MLKNIVFLQDCDIVVKRHLWRDNQSLFGDEVSPYLSQVRVLEYVVKMMLKIIIL